MGSVRDGTGNKMGESTRCDMRVIYRNFRGRQRRSNDKILKGISGREIEGL